MLKAASTSIQYLLSGSLPGFERREWSLEDVNRSVHSAEELQEYLSNDWSASPAMLQYAWCAFRREDQFLVSSESYFHFPANALSTVGLTGLAIVRPPAGWVQSGIVQKVLFEMPMGEPVGSFSLFETRSTDPEAQLRASIELLTNQYRRGLGCMRSWLEVAEWFDLVPYEPNLDVRSVVSGSLGRFGVQLCGDRSALRFRSRYPLLLAQLAMTIALVATEEFGASHFDALRTGQLALGVDPNTLTSHCAAPSVATRLWAAEQLLPAHDDFVSLVRDATSSDVEDLAPPDLQILDPGFAVDLARSLIRTAHRIAVPPPDFDPSAYLETNADVAHHAAMTADPFAFAIDHFMHHGAFEGRPVVGRTAS